MLGWLFQSRGLCAAIVAGVLVMTPCNLLEVTAQRPVSELSIDSSSHIPIIMRSNDELAERIMPLPRSTRRSARLVYSGTCANVEEWLELLQDAKVGSTGDPVARLQSLFSSKQGFRVSLDDDGVIQITQGEPMPLLLQTMIPSLRFDHNERTDSWAAIGRLQSSEAFRAAQQRLGLEPLARIGGLFTPNSRRLSPTMKNMTVDQILARIIDNFGGLLLYGQCAPPEGKPQYEIIFFQR